MPGHHDKDTEDIIDTMIDIMDEDEGPRKYTRKRRNGADQFNDDHHEEYDSSDTERDQVDRVRDHNSTYPKLHESLDNRKSITKVTVIDGRRLPADYDPICSACAKLITRRELERKHVKRKCQVSNRIDKRRRERRPHDKKRGREHERRQTGRISKEKSYSRSHRNFDKTLSQVFSYSKNRCSKSIQCSSIVRNQSTVASKDPPLLLKNSKSRLSNSPSAGKNSITSQKRSPSQNFSNPGSKENSIGSFKSFTSDDEEPMVS